MTIISTKFTFLIRHARSLKDKRMVARSIIDKTRHKYNAGVAEVDTQDIHEKLTIGVAVVSGKHWHAVSIMDEIVRFMEAHTDAELISTQTEEQTC